MTVGDDGIGAMAREVTNRLDTWFLVNMNRLAI
jgi:hypothetical protein